MSGVVLFVDDDHANLTVFEAAFGGEFEVLTADCGAEALELLAQHEVAVLLVDQRMPGMTGVQLLARARAEFPDPIRILITAYSNLGEAIEAINQGHIRRYLRKPWNHEELHATLRDAVEVYEARRQLSMMERQMRESERVYALGVVAAGIAHELRNPMTTLLGQLEMARAQVQRMAPTGPAVDGERSLQDRLDAIQLSAERVREIMEGMSLAHRRQDFERQADLHEVVRLTSASLRGSLQRRAQTALELQRLPPVRGSSTQLGQVVLNLLVNAVQALPDEGRAEAHRVHIRLSRVEDQALLEVTDSGPGIPPELHGRIFDPFFTTKGAGGTGLGLAITRQIVEDLGGRIQVCCPEGGGTRFSVWVPLAG